MLQKHYPLIYGCLFHNVSLQEKVFLDQIASCDVVIIQFVKLASQPSTVPGGLISTKQKEQLRLMGMSLFLQIFGLGIGQIEILI